MTDSDYYILTLAAVARELNIRKLTSTHVHRAAGLPLTWMSEQKDSFKEYLLQNDSADFTFKGVDYHVEFAGADIFPQGFSAVADKLREFKGINMLCDIGNGTMNVMYMDARLAVREVQERYAVDRVKATYGEKYDPIMMHDSKRDVANLLHEEAEVRSIRERLRQK